MQNLPTQAEAYFNARVIRVTEDDGGCCLEFEYQGETVKVPTSSFGTEFEQEHAGKIGVVMRAWHSDGQGERRLYHFNSYFDQSLRRAFELDIFEPDQLSAPHFNANRIGWRNSRHPDGFLAPAGLIPGADGEFIDDETEALTIPVPLEFVELCAEFKASPEEVLRGFIADAASLENFVVRPRADGYSSNGSDERMLAYDYLDRTYGMWRDDGTDSEG